jgi:PAS domain S-box-containing protein
LRRPKLFANIFAIKPEPKLFPPTRSTELSNKKQDIQQLETKIRELEQLRARSEKDKAKLRKSEQMLQLIIDNIPQRVFWKDRNGVYVGCNRVFAEDVGLENASQIAGKTDLDLPLLEQDQELYARSEQFVIDSNTPLLGHEEQFHKPDGSTAWLRTNVVPLHDSKGKVSGLLTTYEDITRQRLSSQQFAESEQRYRMLFENANDAIFIVDRDLNIIDVNRKACWMFGYSRSQLLAMKTHALQPPGHQDKLREGQRRFETQALHPDGRVMNVEISLSPFAMSSRTLHLAIVRDMTEHKNSLELLNSREETVRSIINASVEPMMLLDLDGVILNLNQTAAMKLDAKAEDLIGRDSYEFFDRETAALLREYTELASRWSMPVSFEEKSEGMVFETVIHPVFGSDGQVSRLAVFSRDTTVQRRKELQLKSDELKYRSMFNMLGCAAVLFDAEAGIIREVNSQTEKMLGKSKDEINGMHFSEIFCSCFLNSCHEMLGRATEGEGLQESCLALLETSSEKSLEVIISVRNMWIDNKCYLLALIQQKKQLKSLLHSQDKNKH